MPPNARRKGTFGGSLLARPEPLPEDDTDVPGPQRTQAPAEPVAQTPPAEAAVASATEPEPPKTPPKTARAQRTEPATTPTRREKPPSTLRVNDNAGSALWDAFDEYKRSVDPHISYREFTSRVVLDGLDVHRRRQARSTS